MDEKNILIVDSDREMGEKLKTLLSANGYKAERIETGVDALERVHRNDIGIIFLDFFLPDMNGLDVLKKIQLINPSIIIIMMSVNGTIQRAVEATQQGAYDWLQKPLEDTSVLATVHNAIAQSTFYEGDDFVSEIKTRYMMVGTSRALRRICRIIDRVASQSTIVYITGESGTGKEMVAHAIHLNSERADKPFVRVNCASVHESLIESELFGHKRGSFTGAYMNKQGKFQMANTGTLFLDEIGDLSTSAQAKILRTIETGEVEMLGNEHIENVDVRVISATNKDLNALAAKGAFREDLLHRINVIEINIPPLRERPDDILPLANYFLEMYCSRNKIPIKKLTPSAEAVLLSYSWPGNVRELRNVIEKITILVDSNRINSHHIAEFIKFPDSVNGLSSAKTFKQAKKCFEKSYIIHALWENDWNISKTAVALKLPRSSLYEKIKEYDIKRNPENQTIRLS